jgi:hypothetical protein
MENYKLLLYLRARDTQRPRIKRIQHTTQFQLVGGNASINVPTSTNCVRPWSREELLTLMKRMYEPIVG